MSVTLKISASCKLVNAPGHVLDRLRDLLTMRNPIHDEAVRNDRYTEEPEYLEMFRDTASGFVFPRGFCKQAWEILRSYSIIPVVDDTTTVLPPLELTFRGELRPYQERALRDILARRHGVASLPTGAGKTTLALAVMERRQQPTLVLVHSKELLHQWRDRAQQFLGIEVGMVGDGKFNIQPVTVAIVNSARNRLDELKGKFGMVVVDECHRAPASMFREVVTQMDARYLLGLSATAYRRDKLDRLIYLFMGDRVTRVTEAELQRTGAILKPVINRVMTDFFYPYDDDYQSMISELVDDDGRNALIVENIVGTVNGSGTALVASDRVSHCNILADMLKAEGLKVGMLTGKMTAKARTKVVEDVQAGMVQVLVATSQLIGEGFDCSGLCDLHLATPIRFKGKVTQVVGRILRPDEGKQARVFDYVDHNIGILENQAGGRWRGIV